MGFPENISSSQAALRFNLASAFSFAKYDGAFSCSRVSSLLALCPDPVPAAGIVRIFEERSDERVCGGFTWLNCKPVVGLGLFSEPVHLRRWYLYFCSGTVWLHFLHSFVGSGGPKYLSKLGRKSGHGTNRIDFNQHR
eukprot:TRINITY_DN1127_c0_g1_i9.p1 TRINITY_DN1127_c0_g1~~TRINITY_DN1127_c0_g1_i9.p1  ORF type:complete len:138 (-),score=6.76 TRINITY_DN1127_c0_g1_i9:317-730(-)